jgi:undecaprenyl-diphosphatase
MTLDLIKAVFLGIVEGLTEFIPVSSTGHLLLVGHFFGFDDESFGKSFDVLIQLGAILALLSIYFSRLWRLFLGMFSNREDQRFIIGVLVAFLPAMVIGALAYSTIKSVLFNVWIVCTMLVAGGLVLLWIDRLKLKPRYHDATKFTLPMYLGIGAMQCLSMVPGVSRAGATIVGAMLFGTDKRSAAEFTFFLAMPTMAGAFAFDLYKNWSILKPDDLTNIALGFVVAFISAVFVVRYLLDYVSRHGFALFGWWRIMVGGLAIGALLVMGQGSVCPA